MSTPATPQPIDLSAGLVPKQGVDLSAGLVPASGQSAAQPSTMEGVAQGFGAGAAETLTGLGKIGRHIPGAEYVAGKVGDVLGLPKLPEGVDPYAAVEKGIKPAEEAATKTTAGKIGYGGETLTEFLLGDEALKGMSIADKLDSASKIAKVLEKFPRVMEALQVGADAAAKHPVATKIIAEAARQGTVQAAQTAAKTGGDIKEAAESGAEMAATSGVLGTAAKGVSSLVGKAGKAAETAEKLTEVAKAAPTEAEVTGSAKTAVDSVERAMHDKYEAGIQDLTDRLGAGSVGNAGSPIASSAKDLLKAPEPAEHELVAAAKTAAGERIDKPVKDLLTKASESKEAWSVQDLIDFRQSVRKLADSYQMGDPNARALRKLLPSVDDTIGKLAEQSGDATAKSDYAALRDEYKNKVKFFEPQPSSKPADQLAYNTTKALRSGTKDDIGKYLFSGGNVKAKVKSVQDLLGPDATKSLGKDIFSGMVAESGTAGHANPANLVRMWTKIPDEAKGMLFDSKVGEDAITQLMKDAHSASTIQQLARAGIAAGAGGSIAAIGHSGLGTLLGLTVAGGGFAAGRDLLDHVATHPALWKGLGLVAKGAEAVKPVTTAIGPAVKQQTAQTLMGRPSIANVFGGAEQPLGEQ